MLRGGIGRYFQDNNAGFQALKPYFSLLHGDFKAQGEGGGGGALGRGGEGAGRRGRGGLIKEGKLNIFVFVFIYFQ